MRPPPTMEKQDLTLPVLCQKEFTQVREWHSWVWQGSNQWTQGVVCFSSRWNPVGQYCSEDFVTGNSRSKQRNSRSGAEVTTTCMDTHSLTLHFPTNSSFLHHPKSVIAWLSIGGRRGRPRFKGSIPMPPTSIGACSAQDYPKDWRHNHSREYRLSPVIPTINKSVTSGNVCFLSTRTQEGGKNKYFLNKMHIFFKLLASIRNIFSRSVRGGKSALLYLNVPAGKARANLKMISRNSRRSKLGLLKHFILSEIARPRRRNQATTEQSCNRYIMTYSYQRKRL